jgi:hypothetical protein
MDINNCAQYIHVTGQKNLNVWWTRDGEVIHQLLRKKYQTDEAAFGEVRIQWLKLSVHEEQTDCQLR